MPVLTLEQRARAIGHIEAGTHVKLLHKLFNISPKACYNLVKKYQEDGSVKNRKRTGRPRKTTKDEDENIFTVHLEDRFRNPKETVNDMETDVSVWTVKRRERGMRARKPAIKPKLKESHKDARLKWATTYQKGVKNNGKCYVH